MTISWSASVCAVDLGVDEHAGEVVGRVGPAVGDQRPAALEELGHVLLHDRALAVRVEVRVAGAEHRVHQPRPDRVVLDSGCPMKDPITRDTTGCATSETRSHSSRPSSRSSTPQGDLPDLVLVLGDPPRREPALEQRLEPVVLGRVVGDEHALLELERHDGVRQRGDAAELGRVGLPVAADLVHARPPSSPTSSPPRSGHSCSAPEKCTGHSPRRRLNSSCGGPSAHAAREMTSSSSTGVCGSADKALLLENWPASQTYTD